MKSKLELVDEAVMLHRSIEELTERLKGVKAELVVLAEGLKGSGAATDGGGVSVVMDGRECVARVVFPGPKLISFKKTDKEWPKVAALAGAHFRDLFVATTLAKPAPDFRELAKRLLAEKAGRLIALCEEESKPTVSFEVTENFGEDWP